MNCGRCSCPMNETAGLVWQCQHCHLIIDESRNVCIFQVGKYHITLKDDFGFSHYMNRTTILKGLQQLHIEPELSLHITEAELDKIWKDHKS